MGQFKERILVVEDDRQISNFICYALKNEGFSSCVAAYTAREAESLLASADILLLDLGLPDADGIDIIKQVRQWSEMPVIVVSARDRDAEKATALDSGADDYLTKPFSATELLARIRVAVRHLRKINGASQREPSKKIGGLEINFDKRLVYLDGAETHLTPMEFALLVLFFKNAGKVLSTGHIIKEIWGPGYGTDTQALRALMASLRRKIEKVPATPRYIITEIGVGYRMMDE